MARRSPVESNHVLPTRQSSEPPVTSPSEEPAWKQRAVERSIKTAKLRAAQRVQRFLDAAQAIVLLRLGDVAVLQLRPQVFLLGDQVADLCQCLAVGWSTAIAHRSSVPDMNR